MFKHHTQLLISSHQCFISDYLMRFDGNAFKVQFLGKKAKLRSINMANAWTL